MSGQTFKVMGRPAADRDARVKALEELGFTWANLGEEEYWLDHIVLMNRAVYEELNEASRALWRILDKAARYVHGKRDLYELIGIPPLLWELLDILPMPEEGLISRYARFDFAISQSGAIKLLELNADTPTGYVEASIATPWLLSQAGYQSVNNGMQRLIAEAWGKEQPERAACVGYGEHLEDSGTIEALVKHSGREMICEDCLELWFDKGYLKNKNGDIIERLFALYPKEWMAVDDAGEAMAYALETGRLTLFNSPHSLILQSKGLLAAVWGLYELGLLYNAQEREAISKYMLPTYNKPLFSGDFVSKSMFGREGGSVRMYDPEGTLEVEDADGFDSSVLFPSVYQKRAELACVETSAGKLHLLTGMFVISGEPCGLLGRAGGLITGNTSHFIAIGVDSHE